ncbi:MAG: hypothetical protein GY909_17880 [Oligoflexia bacterium]|nr:hypothetical protein [Oligoflexia bacterium]
MKYLIVLFMMFHIQSNLFAKRILVPNPYKIVSQDKKHIFFMNSDYESYAEIKQWYDKNHSKRKEFKCLHGVDMNDCRNYVEYFRYNSNMYKARKIKSEICKNRFKMKCRWPYEMRSKSKLKSGLYKRGKNGMPSGEPIWTINFNPFSAKLSNSNEILIDPNYGAYDVNSEAVEFYKKGKLLKSYFVYELIKDKKCTDYLSEGIWWRQRPRRDKFLNDKDEYVVTTCENNEITFDVKTGEIKKIVKKVDRNERKRNRRRR